jgi:hypothetical protein
MSPTAKSPFPDAFSAFEAELAKILEHKYLLSEKAGHDVGFERALKDWAAHHRTAWRQELREKAKS